MTAETQYCVTCSKEQQIDEIHQTVKDIHNRLFVGNGNSLVTTIRIHNSEIENLKNSRKRNENCWWDLLRLLIAAALPIMILWWIGKL